MGKNNLILGTARGKLGDIVFYRTGGEQRFRTRVRPTNRRTNAQLLQRCVVATAVKFYSSIAEVGNHAFQNYVGNLKNHQRFMKLNIDALRETALRNIRMWSPLEFSAQNYGNYTHKDSPNIAINTYQISEGDLNQVTAEITNVNGETQFTIGSYMSNLKALTYSDVCAMLGCEYGDQLTFVGCTPALDGRNPTGYINKTMIGRVIMAPANGTRDTLFLTEEGEINDPNQENYGELEIIQGDTLESPSGGYAYLTVQGKTKRVGDWASVGVIVSRFENNTWRRSTSVMIVNPLCANVATLESAMTSYLKSDTSSLYLNQSNEGEEALLAREAQEISRIAPNETVITEKEEKSKRKKE